MTQDLKISTITPAYHLFCYFFPPTGKSITSYIITQKTENTASHNPKLLSGFFEVI